MTRLTWPDKSPRHGFAYKSIPTIKGGMYGGGDVAPLWHEAYGAVLDCVFEMADQISNGNGVKPEQAVEQVLKDEGWRILPTHKRAILQRLNE